MNDTGRVLFISDTHWAIGTLDGDKPLYAEIAFPHDANLEQRRQALVEYLQREGGIEGEVIVAIASGWCMSAVVDVVGNRGDATAALFALEDKLPIAAEDVSADFIWETRSALGVCVPRTKIAPLVEAIESCGLKIVAVCPLPLLALDDLLETRSPDLIVAREYDHLCLLHLVEGSIRCWHLIRCEASELVSRIHILGLQTQKNCLEVLCLEVPTDALAALSSQTQLRLLPTDEVDAPLWSHAVRQASRVFAGRCNAPINLHPSEAKRRSSHQLKKPLIAAAASLLFALLVLMLALLSATWITNRRIAQLHDEQVHLFRQVSGEKARVPGHIARYLTSEYQRLAGGEEGSGGPAPASALLLMSEVFARFPPSTPIQLTRLRFDGDRAELTGRVKTHEETATIASALAGDGVLSVTAPQSNLAPDGKVVFTLQVVRSAQELAGSRQVRP